MLAPHALKLVGALVVVALVAGVVGYISLLQRANEDLTLKLQVAEQQVIQLSNTIRQITTAKQEIELRVEVANQQRATIRRQLAEVQKKLRQQVPPTECKEAIEWAVDNKGDLDW
jgi:uncharacterized protein HemX